MTRIFININSLPDFAEKGVMPFLLQLFLFISAPFSTAQECACPVVQCDPCQRRMVLDSQKLQCTPEKSVVCDNVVCENVDNYFQCLAGAPSLHLPAEDASSRMSTPQYPGSNVVTTPVELPNLEFQHFNDVETTIMADEKPGTVLRLRGPASSKKREVIAPAEGDESWNHLKESKEKIAPLHFAGLYGAKWNGKKMRASKTQSFLDEDGTLSTAQKQSATFSFGAIKGRLDLAAHSEVRVIKEDDHLVFHPLKGSVALKNISAPHMVIFDVGEWRVGKTAGDMRWSQKKNDALIENSKGEAFLRRDQLIAKSESLPEGMELVISDDYGIVHADRDESQWKKTYQLHEKSSSPKQRRVLASSSISSEGCAQPRGEAQQCAWKCFGAKGKSCVNSETTQCVRFTCSLGGEWKMPTRVSGKECKANSVEVHSCN